jgi:hypothetical protein
MARPLLRECRRAGQDNAGAAEPVTLARAPQSRDHAGHMSYTAVALVY